jgi:hypothetical protein
MVRKLNLCFYHDGKLPLLLRKVKDCPLRSNSVNLGELRRVRRLRDYGVQGLRDLGEHVAHAKGGKVCEELLLSTLILI